jgi:hypothetical protein
MSATGSARPIPDGGVNCGSWNTISGSASAASAAISGGASRQLKGTKIVPARVPASCRISISAQFLESVATRTPLAGPNSATSHAASRSTAAFNPA